MSTGIYTSELQKIALDPQNEKLYLMMLFVKKAWHFRNVRLNLLPPCFWRVNHDVFLIFHQPQLAEKNEERVAIEINCVHNFVLFLSLFGCERLQIVVVHYYNGWLGKILHWRDFNVCSLKLNNDILRNKMKTGVRQRQI